MKLLTSLTITAFLGIILFGFVPMNHSSHSNANGEASPCPIAMLLNNVCSSSEVLMTVVHLSALDSFINTLPISGTAFLAFVFGLALVALGRFRSSLFPPVPSLLPELYIHTRQKCLYAILKLRSWLSLFENSPAFA